jgi:hypothetical protein
MLNEVIPGRQNKGKEWRRNDRINRSNDKTEGQNQLKREDRR